MRRKTPPTLGKSLVLEDRKRGEEQGLQRNRVMDG